MTDNARRPCEYCQAAIELITLQRVIMSSGHIHVAWICTACGRYARKSKQFIAHAVIEVWEQYGKIPPRDELPIFADNRLPEVRCFVCGQLEAQLHHFAPKALTKYLGDAELWPKEYLCDEHHQLWHSVLTPWMPNVSSTPTAIEIFKTYY